MRAREIGNFLTDVVKEVSGVHLIQSYNKYDHTYNSRRRILRAARLVTQKIVMPETMAAWERILIVDNVNTPTNDLMLYIDICSAPVVDIASLVLPSILEPRPLSQYSLGQHAEVVIGGKIAFNLVLGVLNTIARRSSPTPLDN